MSVLSTLSKASDTYSALRLLRIITTPWEKMNAYKHGIIDEHGKRNKNTVITQDIGQYYTLFHRLAFNLKRLIEKIPFIGKMTVTSYASALLLLKETIDYKGTDIEFLIEMFGKDKSILLDELNEMMTDSLLYEGKKEEEESSLLNEGDQLVFPLTIENNKSHSSITVIGDDDDGYQSSFMGIPMTKVLYEDEAGQTMTAAIVPIIDRPLFTSSSVDVLKRRISIFDLDPEEYEHYTIRRHGDKWNEKYRQNEKMKRAWRREDLVFLRNKGTGNLCSIGRISKRNDNNNNNSIVNEDQMNNKSQYSLNEIRELLSYQPLHFLTNNEEDDLVESVFEENELLSMALNELHEKSNIIFEETNDDDQQQQRQSFIEQVAKKYNVDEKVLDEMFFEELEDEIFQTDDILQSFIDEANELQKMRDLFNNYRKALEIMHKIVMDNLNDQGKPNKTLDFFAQKTDNQIRGKYDPRKLAVLYKEKYIDKKTGKVIKNKNLSEESISNKEFDELLARLMDTRLGDDFIDATENKDRKAMLRIIDAEIDDNNKSKQVVDRILKNK